MDPAETGTSLQQPMAEEVVETDAISLYGIIDKTKLELPSNFCLSFLTKLHFNSVHGLNLDIPEQARDIIKSWNEREDVTKFADSGVDDQVTTCFVFCPLLLMVPLE